MPTRIMLSISSVWNAGFEGGLAKSLCWVTMGFDEVDFAVGDEAEVDAGLAVDGEEVVDAFADICDFADERRVVSGENDHRLGLGKLEAGRRVSAAFD
jgi:hypothetical protein